MADRLPETLVCFGIEPWESIKSQPMRRLLASAARALRVFYIEESGRIAAGPPRLDIRRDDSGVTILQPLLRNEREQAGPLGAFFASIASKQVVAWHVAPSALSRSSLLDADLVVYQCREVCGPPVDAALMAKADLVFVEDEATYATRHAQHHAVHLVRVEADGIERQWQLMQDAVRGALARKARRTAEPGDVTNIMRFRAR